MADLVPEKGGAVEREGVESGCFGLGGLIGRLAFWRKRCKGGSREGERVHVPGRLLVWGYFFHVGVKDPSFEVFDLFGRVDFAKVAEVV